MKNKNVWIILVGVIVLLVVCGGAYWMMNRNLQENNDNHNVINNSGNKTTQTNKEAVRVSVDENVSNQVVKVEEFELTNISLSYQDEMSDFSAEIKNNSSVDYTEGIEMKISFYRADDSLMFELPVMTSTLLSGGKSTVSARTTLDLTDAKTITVTAVH